jgi:hypothetical protein
MASAVKGIDQRGSSNLVVAGAYLPAAISDATLRHPKHAKETNLAVLALPSLCVIFVNILPPTSTPVYGRFVAVWEKNATGRVARRV